MVRATPTTLYRPVFNRGGLNLDEVIYAAEQLLKGSPVGSPQDLILEDLDQVLKFADSVFAHLPTTPIRGADGALFNLEGGDQEKAQAEVAEAVAGYRASFRTWEAQIAGPPFITLDEGRPEVAVITACYPAQVRVFQATASSGPSFVSSWYPATPLRFTLKFEVLKAFKLSWSQS